MENITKNNSLGDCQDHTPVCYGSNAIKYSHNSNEVAVKKQQIGYEDSVLSVSTSMTLTGSMSMLTIGSTTTMAILMEWLWQSLCSYENLEIAFKKARKRKSKRRDVIEFEKNLETNLNELRTELLLHSYKPKPLKTFIVKDPKTRTIRKSEFRDRIVHHAICNVIEPILEKSFIYDSYANRIGKGTSNAVKRFDLFKRKVSKNNTKICYVLKADIKHYFEEVNHDILLNAIKNKINNKDLLWLIKTILINHSKEKGMPLGNMTSQFFANVYLNELDQFIKHKLKAKHYIRYVDDFVIFHTDKEILKIYKDEIKTFLKEELRLELHDTKSKILILKQGISFLGFRIFPHHKLLRKTNIRTMNKRLIQNNYDSIYNYLEGWLAYAKQADTYNLRKNIEDRFLGNISLPEIDKLSITS